MTVIAGLDVATTTGVCVLDGDHYVMAGAFHWQGENSGQIFRHCRKIIYRLIEKYGVRELAAEEPLRTDIELSGRRNDDGSEGPKTRPPMKTFQRIYGLNAVVEEVCAALDVNHQYINQGTWRKAFTGNGRASKEDSLAYARLIDKSITSLDAAEAVGIAWARRGQLDPRFAAPRDDLFAPTIQPKPEIPF